jgi:hypothetical protein
MNYELGRACCMHAYIHFFYLELLKVQTVLETRTDRRVILN